MTKPDEKEPSAEDHPKPSNVIEAIAAVMRDLPAIGKNQQVQGDGPSYKFRGIEDVTAAAQKLMGKHCVVFVPRLLSSERREVSVGSRGSTWDQYEMKFEYDVYGPGGVADKIVAGPFLALGRDNSDKGTAKAQTMAYKAALVQTFCIGDGANDADNERHENAAKDWFTENGWKDRAEHDRARNDLLDTLRQETPEIQAEFKRLRTDAEIQLNRAVTRAEYDTLTSFLAKLGVEAPAVGYPEAPTGAQEPESGSDDQPVPEADATPDSPPEVPENQESGEPAPLTPDEVAQLDAVDADGVQEEVAKITAMKPGEVRQALDARDLSTDGTPDQQKKRLVLAVLRDRLPKGSA